MAIDFSILNQTNPSLQVSHGILDRVQQMLDRAQKERQIQNEAQNNAVKNNTDQQRATQEGQYQKGLLQNAQQSLGIQQQQVGQEGQYQRGLIGVAGQKNSLQGQQQANELRLGLGQQAINQQQVSQAGQIGMGQLGVAQQQANTGQATAQSEINQRNLQNQMAVQKYQEMKNLDPNDPAGQRAFLAKWGGPGEVQKFDSGQATLKNLNETNISDHLKNTQEATGLANTQLGAFASNYGQSYLKLQQQLNQNPDLNPDQKKAVLDQFAQNGQSQASKIFTDKGLSDQGLGTLDPAIFNQTVAKYGAGFDQAAQNLFKDPAAKSAAIAVGQQMGQQGGQVNNNYSPATKVTGTNFDTPNNLNNTIDASDITGGAASGDGQ